MKDPLAINITYHAREHTKLRTLYNDLRRDKRWAGIGDFPLLSSIVRHCREQGIKVTLNDCAEALRNTIDGEFKKTTPKSDITQALHKS